MGSKKKAKTFEVPLGADDLDNRFAYHKPPDQQTQDAHAAVRAECRVLAGKLAVLVPEGRELAIAVTKIEEAMFWANAGIARHSSAPNAGA